MSQPLGRLTTTVLAIVLASAAVGCGSPAASRGVASGAPTASTERPRTQASASGAGTTPQASGSGPERTPQATCTGPSATAFVGTDGSRLLCGSQPIVLSGFTMYPAMAGGSSAWHRPDFRAYIDKVLDLGAAAGQNLVRPTDEWDKHTQGQTWSDPVVWRNLDYLVNAASRRGMLVVLDLSAFRWLLTSQGRDPFEATAWREFVEFATARYGRAHNVAFWSIVGEPSPPRTSADLQRLATFYSAVLGMVHHSDTNHLVTLGGLNHMEDASVSPPWWETLDALPGNDLVAFKTYSRRDLDLIPAIGEYARQVGRPIIEEEFGMPQASGDGAPSGTPYNGLTEDRATFFDQVYARGSAAGVAAYVFWNLGCQLGPTSYEVGPGTPAVWKVVLDHAPTSPSPSGSTRCG